MAPATSAPAAALRNQRHMSDMRAILRNLRQWPTAADPQGDFQGYVREQFGKGKAETDKARVKALRQQAKDFAILLKNLDRQKDIALVLSGERAPQRELVKMAAARCGLAVPEAAELPDGGLPLKQGYSALRQPWRPDTSSGVAAKYGKRVEKVIGKKDEEAKRLGSSKGGK